MTPDTARRNLLAASCVTAPLFGLAAALASPVLATTATAEMHGIAASPHRFYLYGVCILLSSILLVPAVFTLVDLIRSRRPWGALVVCVVTQIGMLVAVGDAASELVFWQMGAHRRGLGAMVAVTEAYESAPGINLIYSVGGLCTVAGVVALGVLLWRTRALAPWAAAALPIGTVANILGFSVGSRALLAGSYVVLALALVPAAAAIRRAPVAGAPARASEHVAVAAD